MRVYRILLYIYALNCVMYLVSYFLQHQCAPIAFSRPPDAFFYEKNPLKSIKAGPHVGRLFTGGLVMCNGESPRRALVVSGCV